MKHLILIQLCFMCLSVSAQQSLWTAPMEASDVQVQDTKLSVSGSLLVAGRFSGTIDADPGPGEYLLDAGFWNGYNACFVQELSPDGAFIRANVYHGGQNAPIHHISVDPLGYATISGKYSSTADLDPTETVFSRTLPSNYTYDGDYVARISPEGNFLWVHIPMEGDHFNAGTKSYAGDFGKAIVVEDGSHQLNLQILSSSGSLMCQNSFSFPDYGYILSIAADSNGDFIGMGQFRGPVYFYSDDINGWLYYEAFHTAAFLFKMEAATGHITWFKMAAEDIGGILPFSLSIAPDNSIAITGYFVETTDFATDAAQSFLCSSVGTYDRFIWYLDQEGATRWVRTYGDIEWDMDLDVTHDASGNVYTVGQISRPQEYSDMNVCKHSSEGELLWNVVYRTADIDVGSTIVADNEDNLYITAYTGGSLDIDSGPESETVFADFFTLKLAQKKCGEYCSDFILYPNPAESHFFLYNNTYTSAHIVITDLNGKKVAEYELSNYLFEIDVQGLLNGVYLVKIEYDGKVQVIRLQRNG